MLKVGSCGPVDEGIKALLFQRVKDQFNFEGDPINVHKAITTKCGHTNQLCTKFKKLMGTKGEWYARSHPPPKISMEQWNSLIEKKWTNKDWMCIRCDQYGVRGPAGDDVATRIQCKILHPGVAVF